MGRGAALLLALALAAEALPSSSSPAGGVGVSRSTNLASTDAAAAGRGLGRYVGAVAGNKAPPTVTGSAAGQLKLRRAYPTHHGGDTSFTPEAYPVKWNVKPNPPHDDLAAPRSSFTPEAYPVKWNVKPNPPHDDLAAHRSSFTPDVDWNEPRQPQASADAAQTAGRGGHGLHVEPGMLFLRKTLFPGAILPEGTKFAGDATAPAPRSFVSKKAADAIPFGYKQLDTILRMFGIPRGSKKADQVAATLRTCDEPSPEPHTCATSQHAAAAFAAAALGTTEPPRAVVTVVRGDEEDAAGARYAVAPNGVARIGEAVVPCHPMPYPYLVHYCHRPAGVEALRVELRAPAGASGGATAIAMCHADTASWDARNFEMLNATRGEEICHFMPRGYVVYVAV